MSQIFHVQLRSPSVLRIIVSTSNSFVTVRVSLFEYQLENLTAYTVATAFNLAVDLHISTVS